MAKLQAYLCGNCKTGYEFTHIPNDEPAVCPFCGSSNAELQLGGKTFNVIVPMFPGAMKRKAGYIHKYVNRPAEKTSVTVPGKRSVR